MSRLNTMLREIETFQDLAARGVATPFLTVFQLWRARARACVQKNLTSFDARFIQI